MEAEGQSMTLENPWEDAMFLSYRWHSELWYSSGWGDGKQEGKPTGQNLQGGSTWGIKGSLLSAPKILGRFPSRKAVQCRMTEEKCILEETLNGMMNRKNCESSAFYCYLGEELMKRHYGRSIEPWTLFSQNPYTCLSTIWWMPFMLLHKSDLWGFPGRQQCVDDWSCISKDFQGPF